MLWEHIRNGILDMSIKRDDSILILSRKVPLFSLYFAKVTNASPYKLKTDNISYMLDWGAAHNTPEELKPYFY